MSLETRKHKRLQLRIPVKFACKDKDMQKHLCQVGGKLDGELYDISLGGMCVITKHYTPKGVVVKIYMKLPDKENKKQKELELEGEVRSVVPWKGANNRLGIKFVGLDNNTISFIKDFINRNEKRSEPRLNIKDLGKG